MGHYVHLSIVMACNNEDELFKLAKKHLQKDYKCNESLWYLEYLSEGKGYTCGPKGGLSMWGIVGNYTSAEFFVENLRLFWIELFETEVGPFNFEHIIVFYEHEQSEQADAIEISWDKEKKQLKIKDHSLPFAWMQF